MKHIQTFQSSDEDQSYIELPHKPAEISVLKHIPAARKILDGQNKIYQIFSPRCLYTQQITRTQKHLMPRHQETNKTLTNRLISMQDALFQYSNGKQRYRDDNIQLSNNARLTLSQIYGQKQPYYSRFAKNIKKQHFGHIFMNIVGINLQIKNKNNFPHIKHKSITTSMPSNNGSLIFDSHFQNGNLLHVFKNNSIHNSVQTFDLILQNDINTKGHNQWFYFKVTNTKKNQKVKFNIINFVKKQSLFSYGLKPLTYSQKNSKNGISWVRNGLKVCYQPNSIRRQTNDQNYYSLSFQYQFREAFDTVYFAPSYPYTYSQLIHFQDRILSDKKYHGFLNIKKMCQTVGKNTVNIISISTGKKIPSQCKIIWIIARQHPVQTTSSFMAQGMIQYLLNLMIKAKEMNDSFYDNYIFKIIPMLNPDGVIHGNTRAEITGLDPNRVWKKPSKKYTPTIYTLKKQILKFQKQTHMILDLHSHSKKLGCFFYGNYDPSNVSGFRILPSNICESDSRFCYKNCRFRGGNQNSLRRALFNDLNIPFIYTVQCSLLGYLKDNRINEYKIIDYYQMGSKILQSYFNLQRRVKKQNISILKHYPHQKIDFCDAQSARSDSCVSQQQFSQVYDLVKTKNKFKQMANKKNKKGQSLINKCHKSQISQIISIKQNNNPKIKQQINEPKQITQNNLKIIKKHNFLSRQNITQNKRQFSLKSKCFIPNKNIRFNNKKNPYESIKQQYEQNKNKTYGQKSIQVQQLKTLQNYHEISPLKKQKKLMVLGNSVQQQKILITKNNEVGIQNDWSIKQNNNTEFKNKKNNSMKLNFKITKKIQNSQPDILKTRKGVMLFRN